MTVNLGSASTPRKRSSTITWSALNGTDTGALVPGHGFNDKSVHVFGTFGGGTVTFKGGNVQDASNTIALKDFSGTSITFTSAGINSVRDNVAYVHPVVTGGDGSTNLTVVLFME
jgi:hypothetical protein